MKITYTLHGLSKLQAAVAAAPAVVAVQNEMAMREAVALVGDQARANTPEGPGHFGAHAAESFQTSVRIQGQNVVGDISNPLPEARWREFGTQPHQIGISRTSPLKLQLNGDLVFRFRVKHPGTKAAKTLSRALGRDKQAIKILFLEALQRAAASMATKGD